LVRFVKPDVVVAVGGYASFAAGVAAFLSRVPLVVLEQNAIPGRVNRVLARLSRLCAVAFPEAARRLAGRRVEEIGNPVREDLLERFAKIRAEKNDGGFHLLVFGGSQGAHRLNEAAKEFAAGHPDRFADGFSMTHQTGPREIDGVRAFYADRNLPVDARAFIDDMAEAYARASLVFCRAGATTIAELTALGLPSVLVPYPFAADDHQRANAEYLESAGAAEIVNDADLTGGAMARIVDRLRQAPERLLAMADAARSLGKPQAADAIARRIVAMAGGA
ncbi:UDP-N-acetylglucosamine--N-acetylmuramyl-(pentapeptide) pyrophosphoryl-undecaprenol N-acetylglucosamine transferase, partial [bacterium]|nr:UDP-N-acetylglucosamine--N-acetylmuramyl-(pentapeptide) pyrophosphoryl-undecaprenol N-acetylglucosamine transferase [bacterium]